MRYVSIPLPHPDLSLPPDHSSVSWENFLHNLTLLRSTSPSIRLLLFIRHGSVRRDSFGRSYPDASLSPLGRLEVISTATLLDAHFDLGLPRPQTVFTSPMYRAVQTAEILWRKWEMSNQVWTCEWWRTRKNTGKERCWRRRSNIELREGFPELGWVEAGKVESVGGGVSEEGRDEFLEEEEVQRESDEMLDERIKKALGLIWASQTETWTGRGGREGEGVIAGNRTQESDEVKVGKGGGTTKSLNAAPIDGPACIVITCHRNTFRSIRRILKVKEPTGDVPTASMALFVVKQVPEDTEVGFDVFGPGVGSGVGEVEVRSGLGLGLVGRAGVVVKVGIGAEHGLREKHEVVVTTDEEVETESSTD